MAISVGEYPDVPILPYAQAIKLIRPGDILLCSGKSLFSSLIQTFTGSIWSHVGFILRIEAIDCLMVMESVESIGVRTVPLSHYSSNYKGENRPYAGRLLIARHAKFMPERLSSLSHNAVHLLGYKYDENEIIRIAARIGSNTFSRKEECRVLKSDNEYICSEYAYECFKSIGVHISHDCGGFVSPADFARTEDVHGVCGIATK